MTASCCISNRAWSHPWIISPYLRDYGFHICTIKSFEAHLLTSLITPSKNIAKLARLCTTSVSSTSHAYILQVSHQICCIEVTKCISSHTRLRLPMAYNHGLQVHLHTPSIMASWYIMKFTQSWCGGILELECRPPIVNTLSHLACLPKRINEKDRFWPTERRKTVRG